MLGTRILVHPYPAARLNPTPSPVATPVLQFPSYLAVQ